MLSSRTCSVVKYFDINEPNSIRGLSPSSLLATLAQHFKKALVSKFLQISAFFSASIWLSLIAYSYSDFHSTPLLLKHVALPGRMYNVPSLCHIPLPPSTSVARPTSCTHCVVVLLSLVREPLLLLVMEKVISKYQGHVSNKCLHYCNKFRREI